VTARQFYQAGYRRIEDLKPEELTDTQRLGFRFYYHLLERIPRAEITQFQEFLTCLFSNLSLPFEWEIVGSYRRQEESSGDIDILVKDLGPGTLRRFMAPLLTPGENGPLIPGTLSFGEKKFMGILQLTPQHVARRLDVTVVNPDTFPFALLHATGSKQFNQVIRSYALSLGWSLSEYSLTSTATGERYQGPIHSEEDIFRVLGLAFVPPVKRVRNFSELWLAP
jgi:DNA polymerase lambda